VAHFLPPPPVPDLTVRLSTSPVLHGFFLTCPISKGRSGPFPIQRLIPLNFPSISQELRPVLSPPLSPFLLDFSTPTILTPLLCIPPLEKSLLKNRAHPLTGGQIGFPSFPCRVSLILLGFFGKRVFLKGALLYSVSADAWPPPHLQP